MLAVSLARVFGPLVWWGTHRTAHRLLVFARAERASMIDLRLAARATADPRRAAAYLRHADDESRHAVMFVRRAAELLREQGRPAPRDVVVDCESLFARLGELDFLAFVHHGEARGRRQFEAHAAWLAARGRNRDAALFEALIADELRHERYTGELLRELAGDEATARAALARVRRWELGRTWLRMGRAIGSRVYLVLATLLYLVAVVPLSLLIRVARPVRVGFVTPRDGSERPRSSAVLGISGGYHDAAAALVVDGHIVAAVQQERLSRIKNDASLPLDAARACLQHGGITAAALDAVVFYENPFAKLERVMVGLVRHVPASWRQFPRAMASQLGNKLWVLDALADGLEVPRSRVGFEDHHECHAASAYFTSGFDDAAVLVLDGVGEHSSTSIWHGRGDRLDAIEHIEFPHSLGLLYAGLTAWLGFAVNEGEYKVMGLAAWGEPKLEAELSRVVRIDDDGSFELALDCFANMTDAELGFGPELERVLGPRRATDRRWDLDDPVDRRYADVAATLQAVLERAIVGLARRAVRKTGARRLCLAGGVALNCLANARVADTCGLAGVFVQPAAGDAGGALGAAILGALAKGDPRPAAMTDAALGLPISVARAWDVARALGMTTTRLDDPIEAIADRLARGEIVAHAHGRFEWGPRALGQRSIFADPRRLASRERLNRVIKQREPFRPFAPMVRAEDAPAWFAGNADAMTPFMTRTLAVHEHVRDRLAAVTHKDGTARVQTVAADASPRLHALLGAVGRHTDVPLVLNTSLNGPGDPIAAAAEDVLAFGLRHAVDAIVIDDVLIERRPS